MAGIVTQRACSCTGFRVRPARLAGVAGDHEQRPSPAQASCQHKRALEASYPQGDRRPAGSGVQEPCIAAGPEVGQKRARQSRTIIIGQAVAKPSHAKRPRRRISGNCQKASVKPPTNCGQSPANKSKRMEPGFLGESSETKSRHEAYGNACAAGYPATATVGNQVTPRGVWKRVYLYRWICFYDVLSRKPSHATRRMETRGAATSVVRPRRKPSHATRRMETSDVSALAAVTEY